MFLDKEKGWFKQTGLKKQSLVKTEKIAVIHSSLVKKKLGNLPDEILNAVKEQLRKTMKI